MRLKLFACAAVAFIGLAGTARAADPKAKGAAAKKKTASELLVDDKALTKQMSWEDKVMGPDDKRAELDKIARAQAITKAAAEKAEKEKAEKDKQAAREAAQPKPKVTRNDVSLPSVDEESAMKEKAKPEVVEAPPPPVTKGDDKFIDKILKDDGGSKKKLSKENDRELEQLLGSAAKDKPAGAKGKSKKGDMVDNLLDSADKGPAMPAPKTQATLPEWATKPDVAPTPRPAPVVVKAPPKKDDGVIHVVQGAAPTSAPAATTSRPMPVAARVMAPAPAPVPASRRQVAAANARSGGGDWNDPFADSGARKKTMAARETAPSRDPFADDAPAPRKAAPLPPARREPPARAAAPASNNWNDPFADGPGAGGGDRKATKRAPAPASKAAPKSAEPAPRGAGSSGWKDPFTEAPGPSHRPAVAMRDAAPARPQAAPAARGEGGGHSAGWGAVLKKRH